MKKHVTIYTDGACSGNPGPGGWGTILVYQGIEKEMSGAERETTNNRMELWAAIAGLQALNQPCHVTLYSDSKYLCDAITKDWTTRWKQAGWRRADKKPVLNVDLWEKLLSLMEFHEVEIVWVRGHAGHEMNERCDALAVAARERVAKES